MGEAPAIRFEDVAGFLTNQLGFVEDAPIDDAQSYKLPLDEHHHVQILVRGEKGSTVESLHLMLVSPKSFRSVASVCEFTHETGWQVLLNVCISQLIEKTFQKQFVTCVKCGGPTEPRKITNKGRSLMAHACLNESCEGALHLQKAR